MTNMQIPQDIELTSACYAKQPVVGSHTLCEKTMCGKLNIRGDSNHAGVVAAIAKAVMVSPPLEPNTKASNGNISIFWAGPDEWLLHCPSDQTDDIKGALKSQLAALHHAVTDVTDYYTVLQLAGPHSDAVICRGCPMDLHPSAFPAGAIAQTRFGHASILLDRQADETIWEIHVRWTYAEYVWEYLESAIAAL